MKKTDTNKPHWYTILDTYIKAYEGQSDISQRSVRTFVKTINSSCNANLKHATPHIDLIRQVRNEMLDLANSTDQKTVSVPPNAQLRADIETALSSYTPATKVKKTKPQKNLSGIGNAAPNTDFQFCLPFPMPDTNKASSNEYGSLGSLSSSTISATDLMRKEFAPGLQFTGEWKDFLGEPDPAFLMIISSLPGHGKTLFCMKFANYLAENFGRVIFFENEMDEIRTKRLFDFLGERPSANLQFNFRADSPQAIESVLKKGRYDFAFVDSIQMSNFDDEKDLWELKKHYNIGFVGISFANGKGGTRGSIVKQHQGDITINFTAPGVATTIKNRFGPVGKEFQVF